MSYSNTGSYMKNIKKVEDVTPLENIDSFDSYETEASLEVQKVTSGSSADLSFPKPIENTESNTSF
eukprot:Awhi_evm1s1655